MTSNPTSEGLVELILWWRDQSTVAQPDKPGTPWDILTRAASRIEDLETQLEGAKEALMKIRDYGDEFSGEEAQHLGRIANRAISRLAASTLYGLEGDQEVRSSNAIRAATGPVARIAPETEPSAAFQARVEPWMRECFGDVIQFDKTERGDRFLEEVFELLQSGGYAPARVGQLRDYTWNRPVGEPAQEVGGVMVTLAAYCLAFGLDMHGAGETELARIWTKVPQIRAKQAAKPPGIALPIATTRPTERQPEPREAHEKLGEDE